MSECKAKALKWIASLRTGTMQYDLYIRRIIELASAEGLSLVDLGTFEEELKNLRFKCCVYSSENFLKRLSLADYEFEFLIKCMKEGLSSCNLSLENIGTSEDEIEKLRVEACKRSAQRILSHLRNCSTNNNDLYVRCLLEYLCKGGLSPEDVQTNDEELDGLLIVNREIRSFSPYD